MDYDAVEELVGAGHDKQPEPNVKLTFPIVLVLLTVVANIGLTVFGGAYALGQMHSELESVRNDVGRAFKGIDDISARVDNLMSTMLSDARQRR